MPSTNEKPGAQEPDWAAPLNSRAANYVVVNRMRDLAKWLVVVFGAIGSVLLTGTQLSDLGGTEGCDLGIAIVAVAIGLGGALLALLPIAAVLMPIELTLGDIVNDQHTTKLIEREPALVRGETKTVEGLRDALTDANASLAAAEAAVEDDASTEKKEALGRAHRLVQEIEADGSRLLSYALADRVRKKANTAAVALVFGAILVVVGVGGFSWATHRDDSNAAKGEAVPKRASPVTVRLSERGRAQLAASLGRHCTPPHLPAIALGGPADALEMVAVPSAGCNATRFVLTPEVGAIENEKRLRSIRACDSQRPRIPCVWYPNGPPELRGSVVLRQP